MTATESLARAALAPRDRDTDQYLKALTLTNLAAGIGSLGAAERLIDALHFN